MVLLYSFLFAIATFLAKNVSAQRWGRSRSWGHSWSCASLKGCRLVGNSRNSRTYLDDQERVDPGIYKLVCDVNRGLISSVRLFYNGRTTKEYAAPYDFNNLKLQCGDTSRITVSGHSWGQQCFSQDFAFVVDCRPACEGHYQCPTNAQPRNDVDCVEGFVDCECKPGFSEFRPGLCIEQGPICSGYSCPVNSSPVWGRDCLESFDDCECMAGYDRNEVSRQCELSCPNYECPQNGRPRDGRSCVSSFRDCRCNRGFRRDRAAEACSPFCPNFDCPANSSPKPDVDCVRGFGDCKCDNGFKRDGNTKQCIPRCNYDCPPNSSPVLGRTCIKSFDDCQCFNGFAKDFDQETCLFEAGGSGQCDAKYGPAPRDNECDSYSSVGSDEYLRNNGNMLNTADENAADPDFDAEYNPVYDAFCFNEDYPVPSYSLYQQESMYKDYEFAFVEGLSDFSSVSEENNSVTNNRIPGMFLRMCFHDNTIDPGVEKFQDLIQNSIDQFYDDTWPKKWNGPFKYLPTSGGDASLLICPEERLHPNNHYDNTATRVLKSIQKHLKPKYPHLSYSDLLHNGCKAATLFLTEADERSFLERNPFTFGRKDACHVDVKCSRRYPLCGGSEILPGLALSARALNDWFLSRGMNECLWMSTMWTHTTMDNMASMCPITQLTCTTTQAEVDEFVAAESALGSSDQTKLYFEAGDNLDYFDFFLKSGSHQTKLPITDPEGSSCDWDVEVQIAPYQFRSERKPWPLTAVDCTLSLDNVEKEGEFELAQAITNFHGYGHNVVDILGCALGMLSGDGYKEGGICDEISAATCQSPDEHMFGSFFSESYFYPSAAKRVTVDPLCGELGYT